MKMTSLVLALGLGAALGGASVASAEDVPVTLGEALALAEKGNPELQAAAARVDAQAARTESVSRMRWPRLGLGVAWSRMDLPAGVFADKLNSGEFTMADFDVANLNDPGALNHLGTNLSLEMPVDVFGKVGNMAGAMAAYGDAAAAQTRDAAQAIWAHVVEAYRQAEMAGRAIEVTERVLGVASAREAEIQARVDAGGALQAAGPAAGPGASPEARPISRSGAASGAWPRPGSRASSARPPASITSRPRGHRRSLRSAETRAPGWSAPYASGRRWSPRGGRSTLLPRS